MQNHWRFVNRRINMYQKGSASGRLYLLIGFFSAMLNDVLSLEIFVNTASSPSLTRLFHLHALPL